MVGLHDSQISLVGNGKREKRWRHLENQGEIGVGRLVCGCSRGLGEPGRGIRRVRKLVG
jgi:hypothetical protein